MTPLTLGKLGPPKPALYGKNTSTAELPVDKKRAFVHVKDKATLSGDTVTHINEVEALPYEASINAKNKENG